MTQHQYPAPQSNTSSPWWVWLWQAPIQHIQAHAFYRHSQQWLHHTNRQVKAALQQPFTWLFVPEPPQAKHLNIKFLLFPSSFVESLRRNAKAPTFTGHPSNRRNHDRGVSRLVSTEIDSESIHIVTEKHLPSEQTNLTLGDWFLACVDTLKLPTLAPMYTVSAAGLNPEEPAVRAWLTLRDAHKVPPHWKPNKTELHQPVQRIALLRWYSHLQHLEGVTKANVYDDNGDSIQLWQAPQADPNATLNLVADWQSYTTEEQQLLVLAMRSGLLQQVFGFALHHADDVKHTKLSMHTSASPQEAERLLHYGFLNVVSS